MGAVVLGLLFSPGAQASPGDLDLTFSGDGKRTTDFGTGFSRAAATVRQPDGKIVAVGGGGGFALARYNPNGSIDTSFSGDGRQTTDFGGSDEGTGVAIQADGKIVVVGTADASGALPGDFAVARYNPNGSLDPSFSGDGRQTTDFGGFDGANGVAIQPNGKIVAAGGGGGNFALARYNPNGSLDTSFSGNGRQLTDFGGFDGANGVAIQADGKIVAAGSTAERFPDPADFALARYNPNGSLDPSFSGDGKQTTDFGGPDDPANGVALQADGKIVAVGHTGGTRAGGGNFALARYRPNGSLDPSFSGDGRQTTDFGGFFDTAKAVAIQPDGKVVAVGEDGSMFGFGLARFNPNGSLDTSFSGDGKQTTNFGDSDVARGVVLQANGKIVAVGSAGGDFGEDFALARYNLDGSLDASFSGDGKQTTNFPGFDEANGVAIQADGKIVAVGDAGGAGNDFLLARYNTDGSLDTSFSGDGRQTTDFGTYDGATGVALQGDGRIVVVGNSGGDFALARYDPDGSLDPSFSGDGRQRTDFRPYGDAATGVAIQADGKIVVVGVAGGGEYDFAVARYNSNGSLDTSFSGDGRQTTGFFVGVDEASGVALQANGQIVAVGSAYSGFPGYDDLALARYNPNGSLDTGFSGDGKQTTDFSGDYYDDSGTGVALQADGKIVAVGFTGAFGNGDRDFALARYNPGGSLDAGFSGDGKQTTDFGFGAKDEANGVAIQGDGKIVAVGLAGGGATGDDFALARYNPDGSLDASFSGDGKRRTNFGGSDDFANAVALQTDGRVVAAGSGLGTDLTNDFALARYLGG